ncbi:MAG: hypothetical protein AAF693_19200, partial [Bacteroidota bacterium]
YTAEAGFASSSVSATGGSASVTTDGTAGETSGTIQVTFSAGSTAGVGSVILTVVDSEGDEATATAPVTISISPVPTIAGIPTAASIVEGQTLTVPGPITLTSEDGFAASNAFVLQVDGGTAVDLGVMASATSPVELTDVALPTEALTPGTYEILFTLTDGDGDQATFLHILNVEAISFFLADEMDDDDQLFLEINGSINADFTLPTQNDDSDPYSYYVLGGRVKVTNGATLTIPAGSVLKGRTGSGSNATALLIARGSKLIADGTASAPIIFTAFADDLTNQDVAADIFVGTTLNAVDNGLWGGLIILGDAPVAAPDDDPGIEGIPNTDLDGRYGGSTADDNSGIIDYVSVRHGGSLIGSGNEINGISLGGVGSGTTITNVEVVGNNDDGIEWFGGTVDVTNAVVWNAFDDALDTDQDWTGTCSNFIVVTPDGSAFELDGPEPSGTAATGCHSFDDGLVFAGSNIDHLVDWDPDTNAELTNIYFYGWDDTYSSIDDNPATMEDEEFDPIETFGGDGACTSATWEYTLATGGAAVGDIFVGVPGAALTPVAQNANTVGPTDQTGFEWTYAAKAGGLTSIGL